MYLSQKHMLILPGLDIGVHKVLHLTDVLLFQLLETLPTTTHSPCKSQVHLTTLRIWHIYNHSSSINHNTQSLSITGPPHHTAHLAHLQSLLFHQPQHTVLVNHRSTSPHCAFGTFTITPLPSTTTHSPCQLQVHLTTLHIWHIYNHSSSINHNTQYLSITGPPHHTLHIWHIYNHSSSINHNTQSLSITGPPHHTAHLAQHIYSHSSFINRNTQRTLPQHAFGRTHS